MFGKSSNHPTASLPQHGFARTSTWRLTNFSETSATFNLTSEDLDSTSKALWDSDFKLVYTVELEDNALVNEFEVHNPGTSDFECNVLLHTYLRVEVSLHLISLIAECFGNWN